MKKLTIKIKLLLLTIVLIGTTSVKAQDIWLAPEQDWSNSVTSIGIETNYQLTDIDLGNRLGCTVGVNATIFGLYLAYTSNFDNLMNQQSLQSDIHLKQNISSFSIGYNIILAQTPNLDFGITPMASFQTIQSSIASNQDNSSIDIVKTKKVGIGAALTMRGNEFMGQIKITTSEIGAGISFVIPVWDYFYF